MKVIYIAGPYSGPTHDGASFMAIHRNILNAREWAIKVMSTAKVITLTPHLNSYHMELDFHADQDFWYNADLELLKRTDAVFFIPGWEKSHGANIEYEFARKIGIPCFESIEELTAWANQTH